MTAKQNEGARKRPEPVLWHVILFCLGALAMCITVGTFILGDLMLALTLSVTLLAALAVKAFRAFDE